MIIVTNIGIFMVIPYFLNHIFRLLLLLAAFGAVNLHTCLLYVALCSTKYFSTLILHTLTLFMGRSSTKLKQNTFCRIETIYE